MLIDETIIKIANKKDPESGIEFLKSHVDTKIRQLDVEINSLTAEIEKAEEKIAELRRQAEDLAESHGYNKNCDQEQKEKNDLILEPFLTNNEEYSAANSSCFDLIKQLEPFQEQKERLEKELQEELKKFQATAPVIESIDERRAEQQEDTVAQQGGDDIDNSNDSDRDSFASAEGDFGQGFSSLDVEVSHDNLNGNDLETDLAKIPLFEETVPAASLGVDNSSIQGGEGSTEVDAADATQASGPEVSDTNIGENPDEKEEEIPSQPDKSDSETESENIPLFEVEASAASAVVADSGGQGGEGSTEKDMAEDTHASGPEESDTDIGENSDGKKEKRQSPSQLGESDSETKTAETNSSAAEDFAASSSVDNSGIQGDKILTEGGVADNIRPLVVEVIHDILDEIEKDLAKTNSSAAEDSADSSSAEDSGSKGNASSTEKGVAGSRAIHIQPGKQEEVDEIQSPNQNNENSPNNLKGDEKSPSTPVDNSSAESGEKEDDKKASSKPKLEELGQKINVVFVSIVVGLVAGIYSEILQQLLFGKILFGSALLFGYSAPIGLVAGSAVFGLLASLAVLSLIVFAKKAEKKEFLDEIVPSSKAQEILSAIMFFVAFFAVYPNSAGLQMLLFKKVLLGGTLLTNITFALTAAAIVAILFYIAIENEDNFREMSLYTAFFATLGFATPILHALFGITIVGTNPIIWVHSLTAAMVALVITLCIITAVNSATEAGYGFYLTMYATSFAVLSMYITPIQVALISNGLIICTPLLSSIVAITLFSFVSAFVVTSIYRTPEWIFKKLTCAILNTEAKGQAEDKDQAKVENTQKAAGHGIFTSGTLTPESPAENDGKFRDPGVPLSTPKQTSLV